MPPVPPLPASLRTRADFQDFARALWVPVGDALRAEGAAANFARAGENVPRSAALEAFARPLLAVAALHAGGGRFDDWPLVRSVLAAGIDPKNPLFWGEASDWAQPCVEMGALGVVLLLAHDELADRLAPAERDRLIAWLRGIERVKLVENNWRFFRVLVHLGLRRLGSGLAREVVAADLARLETFAREDGWYADGDGGSRDHYIGWAFHHYGLIHARHGADEEPAVAARFRARARAFAPQFSSWFGADGAAIALGRSLIYRFAQGAFWGALAYADEPALPWSQVRGLWARHLRWWATQEFRDERGFVSRGYGYENPECGESYNAPASPYWAAKALLPLALPESHPFWQAEESPAPATDCCEAQTGALALACRDGARGHAFLLAAANTRKGRGVRHGVHKYGKFAYSSAAAFGFGLEGFDSTLGFRRSERDPWEFAYDAPRNPSITEKAVERIWTPWPGVEVTTWLIPVLPGHVRVHRVVTDWSLDAVEGGFAVSACADAPDFTSRIFCLVGKRSEHWHDAPPETHLLFRHSRTPVLRGRLPIGVTWLGSAVWGRPGPSAEKDMIAWRAALDWRSEPSPALSVNGQTWWSAPPAATT